MTLRNLSLIVGCFVLVAIGAVYLSFGTVDPCGIVRAQARQQAQRQGSFGALASMMPDSVIDGLISSAVGPLSPGKCLGLAFTGLPQARVSQPAPPVPAQIQSSIPQPANGHVPPADISLRQALSEASSAAQKCKQERLIGLLKSRVESVRCSNDKIVAAFAAAHYRYMDLINLITANRLAAAEAIDQGKATEAQENLVAAQLMTRIVDEERMRDNPRR